MTDTPILRRARESDLADLVRMEEVAFGVEAFNRKQLRYLLTRAKGEVWVAQCRAELAGYYILLLPSGSSPARLYSLVVNSAWRGAGLSQQLMTHAIKRAKLAGKDRLRLEVSEKNTVAIRLYEKSGFSPVAVLPGYYKETGDGIRMERRL